MADKKESQPPTANRGTTTVTTDGSLVHSDDASSNANASPMQKLKGDVAGAVHGTVGSLQGATGVMLRNKQMEEKGLDKMSEEDRRLAAKQGVPPVGSDRRETKTTNPEAVKTTNPEASKATNAKAGNTTDPGAAAQ